MMNDSMKLLIATGNSGKVVEIADLLADLPVRLLNLKDFPPIAEPSETGATFAENAALKAVYYAAHTGIPALADDSGLEVSALDGAPGVLSARYAGANADDDARIAKLLGALGNCGDRRARFVCAMAIADADGTIRRRAEGFCAGAIALEKRGANGFGYDPIFIPDGFAETFGELSAETKRRISHRKRATDEIIQQLRRFYDNPT